MLKFNFTKTEEKVKRQTENVLADLRQELQDMDIQLISVSNNRNAIIEKINYFENKLPNVITVQANESKLVIDKSTGNATVHPKEVPAA